MSVLANQNIPVHNPCGGGGTCGKCVIRTSEGIKLACQTYVTDGMEIFPSQNAHEDFSALDTYVSQRPFTYDCSNGYGIAIDIGTTTLAYELTDLSTGKRLLTYSSANSQRNLGADVITRIKKATQGAQDELHAYIIGDIRRGITHILEKSALPADAISFVSVAGNTTMLHLLQNMPCNTLGTYPFVPVDISMRRCAFSQVIGDELPGAELIILPGISTFVGADIVAGILCCNPQNRFAPNLLIDLGTNGEMALFTHDRILATSTAAGPAFEAGNISCGTASIPGAIAKVRYSPENNVFIYETIDNRPAIGICGTGVMDIAAELVLHGLADETGRLADEYFDNGVVIAKGLTFTQKDMREIQLAKSAVRSGIEILLDVAGYSYNDIDKVYLAGGFGHKINIDSAVALGLIPSTLAGKVVTVGNTALGGATHVLVSSIAEADVVALAGRAEEINLSAHPRFNDLFMEHMMFYM